MTPVTVPATKAIVRLARNTTTSMMCWRSFASEFSHIHVVFPLILPLFGVPFRDFSGMILLPYDACRGDSQVCVDAVRVILSCNH